jgi:hypothetical protein
MSCQTGEFSMNPSLGARLALPFAMFLGGAEIVRNWGDWGFWPFWVVDYIAVALLLWGWWSAKRRQVGAYAALAGGWGFTCAMFYMSFFSHLSVLDSPDHGPIEHRVLTVIIGILFAITIVGFASALKAAPESAG